MGFQDPVEGKIQGTVVCPEISNKNMVSTTLKHFQLYGTTHYELFWQ